MFGIQVEALLANADKAEEEVSTGGGGGGGGGRQLFVAGLLGAGFRGVNLYQTVVALGGWGKAAGEGGGEREGGRGGGGREEGRGVGGGRMNEKGV